MTEQLRDELADELADAVVPVDVDAETSVLDVIRHRRRSYVAEHSYDMLVPGYAGLLVLRCGPLTREHQTRTRLRLEKLERQKDPSRDFAINADTLISVCEEVLARPSARAPLEPLDPTGESVKIDARLAELLQVETSSARELVLVLFEKAPSPEVAVGVAVNEYLSWAQGLDADADEDLLGES